MVGSWCKYFYFRRKEGGFLANKYTDVPEYYPGNIPGEFKPETIPKVPRIERNTVFMSPS